MISALRRFLRWCLRPLLVRLDRADPGRLLDGLLRLVDGKMTPALAVIPAATDAMPRRSFASGQRFSEQFFRHLKLAQIRRMGAVNPKLIRTMFRSAKYYGEVFPSTLDEAPTALFEELEALATSLGASDLGYIRDIRDHEIFAGKAIPHRGAIVFTVEMDREEMATAPSFEAFNEVSKGYLRLSIVANAITDFLRAQGFAAYPGTALGGTTDYVAVAERAGLGASGYHGLLITAAAGPRVRISTIYTNITNLPLRPSEHGWIPSFCAQCRKCVRGCPPGAIHEQPQPRSGGMACIEYKSCLDYFSANYGCAVCLAVCPFSTAGYAQIKAGFEATRANVEPAAIAQTGGRGRRVAVVGAGPAGLFVSKALLERDPAMEVDLIERLTTPHGLLRFGVAPDHPEVKSKAWLFNRILADPRVRLFANVDYGGALTREDLLPRYDAVVYATGASASRSLGIPGEQLAGSLGAAEFVAWYNGHPDQAELAPPLDQAQVAVIGAGNVALDVTRMLLSDPAALAATDMSGAALAALRRSKVTDVHILVRRGPAEVGFTPKELRELAELPGVSVCTERADLEHPRPEQLDERARRNLELLESFAVDPNEATTPKRVHFHFHSSPIAILGDDRVQFLAAKRQAPGGEAVEFRLPVALLLRSIGYRSAAIPGVPFDDRRHVIRNRDGRVIDGEGHTRTGEYASGWVRRGPLGIIGTNKFDAEQVAGAILEDLATGGPSGPQPEQVGDLAALLRERGVRWVDYPDWQRIEHEERRLGSKQHRVAEKFTSTAQVLEFLGEDPRTPDNGRPP